MYVLWLVWCSSTFSYFYDKCLLLLLCDEPFVAVKRCWFQMLFQSQRFLFYFLHALYYLKNSCADLYWGTFFKSPLRPCMAFQSGLWSKCSQRNNWAQTLLSFFFYFYILWEASYTLTFGAFIYFLILLTLATLYNSILFPSVLLPQLWLFVFCRDWYFLCKHFWSMFCRRLILAWFYCHMMP